ncbi:MAG: hypothetical protein WBG17_00665 [Burkholderiaceae bacterium]
MRILDIPELAGLDYKIEIGEFNAIKGGEEHAYSVTTLYNAIFGGGAEEEIVIPAPPEPAPRQPRGVRYVEPICDSSIFQDSYGRRGTYEDI